MGFSKQSLIGFGIEKGGFRLLCLLAVSHYDFSD